MKNFLLISVLFFMLFLPFVHSAPPVTFISSNTMQIETPKYDVIKLGEEHRFHAHVINQTSPKTNRTTSCFVHVYNQTGYDIATNFMDWETYNNVDFAYTVNGKNFSRVGMYAYVIQCNSSTEVAFASGQLDVTQNGQIATVESILLEPYLLLFISIMFLVSAITFSNDRWVVKSSLFMISLLFIILSINSSLGYTMNDKSTSMLNSGFIIAVVSVSLLFIIMIVLYLRSLARAIKKSRKEEKEDLL